MTVRLIVNADDYGYFPAVSAGIAAAVAAGVVTATGVMANGPAFEQCVAQLHELPQVDVGVHLNVTYGRPLTADFPRLSAAADDRLPGTARLAAALLTGRLPAAAVEREWRAQLQRCQTAGLDLRFVNSHEHVHMLPFLYSVIHKLAREFGIAHVRYTQPEWSLRGGMAGIKRALVMGGFGLLNAPAPSTPRMLGLAPSGHLDLAYFRSVLPRLRDGDYELMCHPGHVDDAAAADPGLRHYHDWKGELGSLTSEGFRKLLRDHHIELIRFRDLH